MAKPHAKVDAVIIGVGWVGGIIAHELTKAGLKVVGLERGTKRGVANFQRDHDELAYAIRYELFQDTSRETWTLRHNLREPALPIPTVVKTKRFNMKPMHPDEAALQLELVGHEFYVFLNAESDAVAVIYRRRDGNLGVIEPVAG